jgi:hypothetical protein
MYRFTRQANQTITPRLSKSKSIDMRFHWLQDRIQRKQFRVEHVAGQNNIAHRGLFYQSPVPDQASTVCSLLTFEAFCFCAVDPVNP